MLEKKIIATKMLSKKSGMATDKKLSDLFDRVLRAKSVDETRFMICMTYWDYEKKTLVATDGRRLHMLTGNIVNDFFSDVATSCFVERQGDMVVLYDKDYAAYPTWQKVVPDSSKLEKVKSIIDGNHADHKYVDFKADFYSKKTMHGGALSSTIIAIGLCLDTSYLFDLIGGEYTVERTHKDKSGQRESRAIKLIEESKDYTFTAVIMPKEPNYTIEN